MKIGLASIEFRNNQIAFNLAQMKTAMKDAKELGCDLVCFGEAFLQGFDAFTWTFELDRSIALEQYDQVIEELLSASEDLGIDLAFGYLEREGETLYSSYLLAEKGRISQNYRRLSRGWKEFSRTDRHYQEGNGVEPFDYRGARTVMALCGDLWDCPEAFQKGQELTLWPVYTDYSLEQWTEVSQEYAQQAGKLPGDVVLINSICRPTAFGGCFHYRDGKVIRALSPGSEGVLIIETRDTLPDTAEGSRTKKTVQEA